MHIHEKYMQRCIDLASFGIGNVAPNPLVGSVIVFNDTIIGEGYHQQYGGPHAEVNAINSVKDENLLEESTIYVNLEPCSHYGKTPPCADLIISKKIPNVVIGTRDPFEAVDGKGIEKLKKAGCNVITGVLSNECNFLNRRFFTFHKNKRPYIILKWAKTSDGFIDLAPEKKTEIGPTWITDEKIRILVHKWRAEEQAILTGKNTVVRDNPSLTTRDWNGKSPLRIILANVLPDIKNYHIFDNATPTLVFTNENRENLSLTEFIKTDLNLPFLPQLLDVLYQKNIQSLIVEGGAKVFGTFINAGMWDEARILTGNKNFKTGIPAPMLNGRIISEQRFESDTITTMLNAAM